jgi:hypothetical protein
MKAHECRSRARLILDLYMGLSGQLHSTAALLPRKEQPVPTEYDVEWDPETLLIFWRREIFVASAGKRNPDFPVVA